MPPGQPADGMRGEPPDLAEVVLEGGPIDPEVGQLLLEDLGRDAVEEQVDAEDDDDEIVEHAEHGHAIGDDVERKGEVPSAPPRRALREAGTRSSLSSAQTSRT